MKEDQIHLQMEELRQGRCQKSRYRSLAACATPSCARFSRSTERERLESIEQSSMLPEMMPTPAGTFVVRKTDSRGIPARAFLMAGWS